MKVLSYCHIKPLFAFCTGCGATLEFVRREAKMSKIHLVNGTQNDGKDYYIICPVCGKIIYENTWKMYRRNGGKKSCGNESGIWGKS